jgi:N-acetylglucosamine kinase-like BadF-type ATPase
VTEQRLHGQPAAEADDSPPEIAVVAVDGGNSKTDVALVGADGAVLGVARGPSTSHQAVGSRTAMRTLVALVDAAASEGGRSGAARGATHAAVLVHCVAGADLRSDDRLIERWLRPLGLADRTIVRNDAFAGLRAGAASGWGVSVVCGAGLNCVGIGPTGRTVRYPALGEISGDWGGGLGVGTAALGAAVRARDGRGQRTALETLVPAWFALSRPLALVEAIHLGRIGEARLGELAPVVFDAAGEGDAVARSIVDRVADEVVLIAVSAIRRLGVARRPVEVVLAGGLFRTDDSPFHDRVDRGIHAVAPWAVVHRLAAPPVLGAALLGLDALGVTAAAEVRARVELTVERLERASSTDRLERAASADRPSEAR